MNRSTWQVLLGVMTLTATFLSNAQGVSERPRSLTQEEANRIIKSIPPAELAARRRASRAQAEKRLGGFLQAPAKGKVVRIVNAQKQLPADFISQIVKIVSATMRYYLVVSEKPVAESAATIELVERGDQPVLLIAPENFHGTLNIAGLSADNPKPEKLKQRFVKEFWRCFAMTLGAGNSAHKPCLMQPVSSLSDLDQISVMMPSPEPYGKIEETAQKLHLARIRTVSYKTACSEGWAPMPTNDIQKAIWENAHSAKERGPTNPIRILPEKK